MLGLALALTGCAVGPDYRAPQPALPPSWSAATAAAGVQTGAPIDAVWWNAFGDPLLSRLVERALASNTDLRIAQARLRSARASSTIAGAARYPSVTASASAARTASGESSATSSYAAGFDARWEIDVFGGVRRGVEAATADEQASAATLAATRVSLAAEVARNYVDVRSYQVRIQIAHDNFASQSETLQLTRWRAQSGLATSLDVEQARANSEQTRAQIPALESALAQSRHALALLLNLAPATLDRELASESPALPQAVTAIALGIPADTLRRRPDVVAAERSLAAANARIGVAEAARYPSFVLSGSIGLQALSFGGLGGSDASTRSLIGSITAPIFDAGRLKQQVEIRSAEQEQALATYEATLNGALRDVEDALTAIATGRERAEALTQAAEAARNAALLANYRYRSGLTDFQTVLDTERTVRTIEDNVAVNEASTMTALIQLYKALGGGWTVDADATLAHGSRP